MPDTSDLTTYHLRLSDDLETRRQPDGLLLVKQLRNAVYLALTHEQEHILEYFRDGAVVSDVLETCLTAGKGIDIRGFYDLVVFSLSNGFLVESRCKTSYRSESPSYIQWCCGTKLPVATTLAGIGVTMAVLSLMQTKPMLPLDLSGWLTAIAVIAVSMSLSSVASGIALSGYGRCIYRPRICFGVGIPHFAIDARDAFMAGRQAEAAVSLQSLAVPLILMGAFSLADWNEGYFGAILAAMVTGCPFGKTPAHSLLHAAFRKSCQLPHCAASFVGKKLFRHLFGSSKSNENDYLLIYSAYAIFWFGTLVMMVSGFIRRQGQPIADQLLFAPDMCTRIGAFFILVILTAFLIAPLLYQLWFVAYNAYSLVAPYWFQAESRIRRFSLESKDTPRSEEIVTFLKETMLFGEIDNGTVEALAEAMDVVKVDAGITIIREGDIGDTLFVTLEGQVEVLKDDDAGHARKLAVLGPGDAFGEIALLDNIRRTASVRTRTPCLLLALSKREFDDILLATLGADRIRTLIQVCSFLKRNTMFRNWDDKTIQALAGKIQIVEFDADTIIIQEGERNETFYIVRDGTVTIQKGEDTLAELHENDFFGEISLLRGVPAVATARAAGPAICLRLAADDFRILISRDLHTGIEIEDALESRLIEGGHNV